MTITEDLILYVFLGSAALFVVLDLLAPARRFPKLRLWKLQGAAFFVLSFVVSSVAPFLWDGWLAEHTLFDASALGIGWGAIVGFLVVEVGVYAWHRLDHALPFLWRFHRTHHSAERLDIWSSFIFHPFDTVGFSFVTSLALVGGIGLQAEAALLAVGAVNVLALWQHANLKTPRWLGYFIVRPEMHQAHHERGVHGRNYSDLPVIDMLFGSYYNPPRFDGQVGFYEGASRELGALLQGRELAEEEAPSSLVSSRSSY